MKIVYEKYKLSNSVGGWGEFDTLEEAIVAAKQFESSPSYTKEIELSIICPVPQDIKAWQQK